MSFTIKDSKGRVLIRGNRYGKLAVSRYPDLSLDQINDIIFCYRNIVGNTISNAESNEIAKFLMFQDKEKFCS